MDSWSLRFNDRSILYFVILYIRTNRCGIEQKITLGIHSVIDTRKDCLRADAIQARSLIWMGMIMGSYDSSVEISALLACIGMIVKMLQINTRSLHNTATMFIMIIMY